MWRESNDASTSFSENSAHADGAASMFNEIEICRICGCRSLVEIFDLGEQAFANGIPESRCQQSPSGPLRLVKCAGDCGLVQLGHSYTDSIDTLSGHGFWKPSHLDVASEAHLRRCVAIANDVVPLGPGDVVLDVGGESPAALKAYVEYDCRLVRIDEGGKVLRQGDPTGTQLLPGPFNAQSYQKHLHGQLAKTIISFDMLSRIDDPVNFLRQIRECMDEEGICVLEQNYLPLMVERNAYFMVRHEHACYFGLRQIQWMANRVGLKILDIELNEHKGGSFRVTVAKASSVRPANTDFIDLVLTHELNNGYHDWDIFDQFRENAIQHRSELCGLMEKLHRIGKTVYGYGCSSVGNILLQYCGVTQEQMPAIVDIHGDLAGAFTPRSSIPIVGDTFVRNRPPDYLVVLPSFAREDVIQREQNFLAQGGSLIFLHPTIEIFALPRSFRMAA
jgi:NDP-4-keto-2,6-dideoxyhexose 3-C-methyltransferase